MQKFLVGVLILVTAGAALGGRTTVTHERYVAPVFLTGLEDAPQIQGVVPGPTRSHHLDDLVGFADTMGTTWYDTQSNGTAGKAIAVDNEGYVHCVWMKGFQSGSTTRHVMYNVWDPTT